MLGVAGIVGALTVFLFVWGVEAPHDQCAAHPGCQPEFSGACRGVPNDSDFRIRIAARPEFFQPIASHEVDLYEDATEQQGKDAIVRSVIDESQSGI